MSYNGSGTFNINSTGQPVVTGTVISSTVFNALTSDLATGLTTAITKDGQTTTTVRIPFAQGINSTLTTDATNSTTGSIITAGGISCQKALVIGTTLTFGGYAAEGTVTAASTTDLSTSSANRQSVTGNTTITSFGSGANLYRVIRFTGNPLITYNATTLITPTGANIQAAPGDVATLSSDGSGNWRIISYAPYGGSLSASASSVSISNSGVAITSISVPPGKWSLSGQMSTGSGGANDWGKVAISTTSGSGGGTAGVSSVFCAWNNSAGVAGASIPPFDVTLTATTTYYLNGFCGTGTPSMDGGSIHAQRIY